jgi:hypothetical protein
MRAPPTGLRARGVLAIGLGLAAVACYGSKSPAPAGGGGETTPSFTCPNETSDVAHEKVKACLGTGPSEPTCLDAIFAPYLETHTTAEALALLQCFEDHDTTLLGDCHPIAHSIGRLTFVHAKTVDASFAACDATCHSGCYHGAMERFLRGDSTSSDHITLQELQVKAATACSTTTDSRLLFQCLHGLGHALLYYSSYALKASLSICSSTGAGWNEASCWGGVFMENIVAADPTQRDLSPTDYHYPCDALDDRYGDTCYQMQTSRMSEMGLDSAHIIVECRKANAHRPMCMQSLGRDLSNAVRTGDPKAVVAVCETGVAEDTSACTGGVVDALIDNTWDGRYALPYCALYPDEASATDCFASSMGHLKGVYGKTTDDLVAECNTLVPGSALCLAAAKS